MASTSAGEPRYLGVIEQELAILCDVTVPSEAKQLWVVYRTSVGIQTLSLAIEDEVLNCTAGLIVEFAQELLRRPRAEIIDVRIAFYPSKKELKYNLSVNESISQVMNQREGTPQAFVLEIHEGGDAVPGVAWNASYTL
eukprot:s1436_g19.t1